LTLHHVQNNRVPLGASTPEVLKHLHALWKFPVILKTVDTQQQVQAEYHCPPKPVVVPGDEGTT